MEMDWSPVLFQLTTTKDKRPLPRLTFGAFMPSVADVSVLIPCYNMARYVRKTVDSVLAQTTTPREVIIVDDGSTDESARILAEYKPPVRVVTQSNQGFVAARNRGIEEAQAEWIALLDADDYWMPEKLERQLATTAPDVIASHTGHLTFSEGYEKESEPPSVPPEVLYSPAYIMAETPILPSTLIYRRSANLRLNPNYFTQADVALFAELSVRGRITFVPEPLTGYRKHQESMTSARFAPLDWFRSTDRWVVDNPLGLNETDLQKVRTRWVDRLVDYAHEAKWKRKWATYHAIREQLKGYRESPRAAALLRSPVLPTWVYTFKDKVMSAVRGRRT